MNKYYEKAIRLFDIELDNLHSESEDKVGTIISEHDIGVIISKKTCVMGLIYRTLFNALSKGEFEDYFHMTNIVRLLSTALEFLPLRRAEIARIMLNFISDCPINLEGEGLDYYKIYFSYFPSNVLGVHLLAASHGNYEPLATTIEGNDELLQIIKSDEKDYKLDLNNISANISKIKENYSNIPDTFDEINILNVYRAFLELGVSLEVAEMIEQELWNQLEKRRKESTTETIVVPKKVAEPKPSKYISDKEYKNLLKEVKKYYNPYTRELTNEFISSEERERIAAIMVRLGLEQYQVIDFLKKTETASKTYTYEYFKDHVEEFEYYFGENLSQVHEYMKEIETCTDDEDKEYWIMGINEELAKLENSYKLDSYEYETKLIKEQGTQHE